jgi:transcriptional regulator with XRE-family HTH domain
MNMPDRDSEIGQRLRQLRQRLGLSQREVGRRAGVSNATISMIEANRVSPSVSALKQILSALGAGLADFFASTDDERDRVMFRADELTEIAGGAISYRQVGANLQGHALQMLHERYRPGAQSGKKMLSHQGEEALEVDGRRYQLGPGDAYSFDSRKPHSFHNIGDTELVVVSACTPPSF